MVYPTDWGTCRHRLVAQNTSSSAVLYSYSKISTYCTSFIWDNERDQPRLPYEKHYSKLQMMNECEL